MKVYGIRQCDTCRQALKFLDAQGTEYQFVDLRQAPVAQQQLQAWLTALGPEQLINRRSTTWRQLSDRHKQQIMAGDPTVLAANPTLIKRPLVEWEDGATVGFDQNRWQQRL